MTTVEYALRRNPEEYERLRSQARMWDDATGRLLDRVGLAAGTSCLDAGCGPGETMRLMAMRTGPGGRVTGIDVDAPLGVQAQEMLHEEGHRQCRVIAHDLTADEPIPGGPYDVVFARLLLLHLPERVAVLRRLWEAVAPDGHLLVQDYDMGPIGTIPHSEPAGLVSRLLIETFGVVGCDVRVGMTLPTLFAEAGIGTPDGTDVAGYLTSLGTGRVMLTNTFRSVLPAAIGHGVTTEAQAEDALAAMNEDALRDPGRPMMFPLMIGAWKKR